jgi:hypothetical protein
MFDSSAIIALRSRAAEFAMTMMLCLCVVAPPIPLGQQLFFIKAEQLLLVLFTGCYVWLLLAGIARKMRPGMMAAIGVVYCICNAFSIWFGAEVLGHRVIISDYYELPKVLLPTAFFVFAYESRLSDCSLQRLIGWFSWASLAVCLYAWSQFIGLGISLKLNALYSSGGHIDLALQYARRVYATMGNPNVLGQLMTWCIVLFLLAAFLGIGSRVWNSMALTACLVTLGMTGSRYGLLTAAGGIILVILLLARKGSGSAAKLTALIVIIPALAWIYMEVARSNPRTLERYETLRNPLQIDSLRQRLDDVWQQEWSDFAESPIVGHGPAKAVFTSGFADSEYLAVLREKGLLGLVVFLGYYIYPIATIVKQRRRSPPEAKWTAVRTAVAYYGICIGLLALAMNVGMSTFYNPFLQGFLWLWLGLAVRAAKPESDSEAHPGKRFVMIHLPTAEAKGVR